MNENKMNENETNRVPREFWMPGCAPKFTSKIEVEKDHKLCGEIIHVREVFDEPVNPLAYWVKAKQEGKVVEFRFRDEPDDWTAVHYLFEGNDHNYLNKTYEFRIKPEPKYRPWKPEEVPVGAPVRHKNKSSSTWLIECAGMSGDIFISVIGSITNQDQLNRFEHSLDHGLTWKPCGVLEEQYAICNAH